MVNLTNNSSLNDLIFEIMNRSEFTDFLNISNSNIQAGYDIQNIHLNEYENQTQLLNVFQDLSIGHSFFFLNEQDFHYRKVNLPLNRGFNFNINKDKVIKFSNYDEGLSQVYEKIYYEDNDNISFIAPTVKYNKSKTIEVKGIKNNNERQNIVNAIGAITSLARKKVTIEIPYFPDINIFDEVTVEEPIFLLKDAFVWDLSKFDDRKKLDAFYRADNINLSQTWLVIDINYSNFTTKLKLQEIR